MLAKEVGSVVMIGGNALFFLSVYFTPAKRQKKRLPKSAYLLWTDSSPLANTMNN
jgi:hypothetical protein